MTRYSDNREQNLEIKQLRKLLLELDDRIVVPESVRGHMLRPRLDDVRQEGAAHFTFGGRGSLRFGLAFAAAFALIVGLVFTLDSSRPEMIEDSLLIEQSGEGRGFINPLEEAEPSEPAQQAFSAAGESATAERFSTAPEENLPSGSEPEAHGVGGGGESVLLAAKDGLSFRLRANDPNDPDASEAAHTLEIVDDETSLLVGQASIPDMLAATECLVLEQEVVLVVESADGLMAKFYDISDPAAPAEQISLPLAGVYSRTVESGGALRFLTLAEGELPPGCEADSPETSESSADSAESFCLVTTVDLATLESTQKAYLGPDGLNRALLAAGK